MSGKIKNGDKPIAPVYYTNGAIANDNEQFFNRDGLLIGLTKREYFAGLAMQGMLANEDYNVLKIEQLSSWIVHRADSLLAELERTKNKQDE